MQQPAEPAMPDPTSASASASALASADIDLPSLEPLFRPRSIAVLGASSSPTKVGGRPVAALIRNRFEGAIYPVNPRSDTIQGLPAFASVKDIPGAVDLAVCTVPPAAVMTVLAECAEKEVGALVVFTSGFAEVGEGDAQEAMAGLAREAGIRLMGPNCMGMANFGSRAIASFHPAFAEESGHPAPDGRGVRLDDLARLREEGDLDPVRHPGPLEEGAKAVPQGERQLRPPGSAPDHRDPEPPAALQAVPLDRRPPFPEDVDRLDPEGVLLRPLDGVQGRLRADVDGEEVEADGGPAGREDPPPPRRPAIIPRAFRKKSLLFFVTGHGMGLGKGIRFAAYGFKFLPDPGYFRSRFFSDFCRTPPR